MSLKHKRNKSWKKIVKFNSEISHVIVTFGRAILQDYLTEVFRKMIQYIWITKEEFPEVKLATTSLYLSFLFVHRLL